MILVTRLNGKQFYINALFVETIEETPDTLIVLSTGKKINVLEQATDVVDLIKGYLKEVGVVRSIAENRDAGGS